MVVQKSHNIFSYFDILAENMGMRMSLSLRENQLKI